MAAPAGRRNVRVIHGRFRIAAALDLVRVAMAIHTRRGGILARLARFGVHRMRVGRRGIGVALGTAHFTGWILVRQAFHIQMAVNARKKPPVNRVLELTSINSQTHCRAIDVGRCQNRICVTREAVSVFELLRRDRVRGPGEKNQHKQTSR